MDQVVLLLPMNFLSLLERGGPVFWLILLLSFLMWSLITLCYIHILLGRRDQPSITCQGRVQLISALVQILPMVGLLGTVEGMIDVFHVIASHGGGNIRGMAGGISTALITTMAGLVTSLSGLYFVSDIKHRLAGPAGYLEAG